ncbi:HEAT repeat domain-containing protein [Grimontia sp. S25]|uniref:HEAT repeat domain-containing protein n=1 Tax=Grimontia sedimenti TaxID=2711294 RepID=A0A6M1RJ51_9GAMM|nr:HEAT repeat domain-containing protein [Grimontia sedimenti]NGN97619.1 HEAT repeat domain-containing protein [Grimontia sedimenti]
MDAVDTEVETLKDQFLCSDWDSLLKTSDKLVDIGGDAVSLFFIECLDSVNADVRNGAALALRDIGDKRAVDPLIEGVLNPVDPKRCATLAYALETHDCSSKFLDVFRILFYSNYECKWSALNILNEQKFSFTDEDLLKVKRMWEECHLAPELCPAFEDSKDRIQHNVDSFLLYLFD